MRKEYIEENILKISGCNNEVWHINDDFSFDLEGEKIPLTPWRYDRRLQAMRSLALKKNVLRRICSYKSTQVGNVCKNLKDELYKEIDKCRWLLDDEIVSVYAVENGGKTLSAILKTQKGVLCNIDIALTLSEDTPPISKHEFVGVEGMICDRSINEQIPVSAVYLFEKDNKDPKTYTDMDADMFGLEPQEIMIVDNIAELLKKGIDRDSVCIEDEKSRRLVDFVFESVATGKVIGTEG